MTKEKFSDLILECEQTMYRVSMSMLRNESDCEDAVQTAILGITEVCHVQAGVSIEEGRTTCILSKDTDPEAIRRAGIVFDTMIAGLRSIQASYPKTLKFRNKEV